MTLARCSLGSPAVPLTVCPRQIPRAPSTAPLRPPSVSPSVRRRGAPLAATSSPSTTTAPSPPSSPELLPTTSRFDRSLERVVPPSKSSSSARKEVREGYWEWEGNRIRYLRAGFDDDDGDDSRPLLVLVHGFGANAGQFSRGNLVPLAEAGCAVAAVDLLGYGYSSKPDPRTPGGPPNQVYSMENWARQVLDFAKGPCGCGGNGKRRAFLITNSIGGIVALQAAVYSAEEALRRGGSSPPVVAGVQLMDVSLRMLHETKQPALARPLVSALQTLLRETPLGAAFFRSVAKPGTVSKILKEAYGDASAVDDELVDVILRPGLEPGATEVFLDFISYSGGPLAEELLAKLSDLNGEAGEASNKIPVSVLWGEADPWEKVEWGAELAAQAAATEDLAREWREINGGRVGNGAVAVFGGDCVEEFVPLTGCGHCPHDEAPDVVNPLVLRFVRRHAVSG